MRILENLPFLAAQLKMGWEKFKRDWVRTGLESRAVTLAYEFRGLRLVGSYLMRHETIKHPEDCPCEYAGYYTTVYATRGGKKFYDTQAGFVPGTTDDEIRDFIKAMREDK